MDGTTSTQPRFLNSLAFCLMYAGQVPDSVVWEACYFSVIPQLLSLQQIMVRACHFCVQGLTVLEVSDLPLCQNARAT